MRKGEQRHLLRLDLLNASSLTSGTAVRHSIRRAVLLQLRQNALEGGVSLCSALS